MKTLYLALVLLLLVISCAPTDPKISEIKERGTLIVGADIPYGVMEYYDENGNPAGIDVELAKKIADRLDVDLEFRKVAWDDLFVALENNEIDLAISSITITDERKQSMIFSSPYFEGGQVIVYKKDHPPITSHVVIHDEEEKVGVQSSTTGEIEAKKIFHEDDVVTYEIIDIENTESGIVYDLLNDNIQHAIMDRVVALQLVSSNSDEFKIYSEQLTQEEYGVAAKLGNDALIAVVNLVIADQD